MHIVVVPLLLMQLAMDAAADIALDGCESKCGDMDIPYPFGTSQACHRRGFKVTCDRAFDPPKLSLEKDGPEVLDISVPNRTVRVRATVWSFAAGNASDAEVRVLATNLEPYVLSAAQNRLVLVGCGFHALVRTRTTSSSSQAGGATFGSCAPSCPGDKQQQLQHDRCDGVGCCQVSIPTSLSSFHVQFSNGTAPPPWVAPNASVLAVEQDWWRDAQNVLTVKMSLLSSGNVAGLVVPAVLDWTVGESSCAEAAKRPESGCVSKNSECLNSSSSAYGYVCRCNDGYDGNPYMADGCQGPGVHVLAGVFLAMGIGIGIFLLLLVLPAIFATKRLKIRKAKKMREFFKINHGLEELKKATNTFDESARRGDAAFASCAPSCPGSKKRKLRHGPCDGAGCCEAPFPTGLVTSFFDVQFSWLQLNATARPAWVAPGASVLVVEQEWWRDRDNVVPVKLSLLSSGNATGFVIRAVLDWTLNETSCAAAAKRPDFGCVSKNSECINSTSSAYGYVCRCNDGYNGNPYVPNGCQGSRMHIAAGVFFAMGVGIGMFVLLLVFAAILATKRLRIRKAMKMREKFFKRNRRLLLRQLVDKDIAEMMIFSLEELEKATNKFDETRILGGGGHGTVYKGILSNQRVVAIKMSKLLVQREVDEFINEVAILSQINHRNVVKLIGCCLETEVPLLVYEFIPNGTRYAHLHVDNPQKPLTWKDRLRIAFEVASSLAYLHAAASTSVVHRDIKTSNILLDDRLTAKASDFGASRGIAIDQSGVTTGIQGTFGYMDPEYYYTRRLTDKVDVYSYGVMLVELLTRKKPIMYISPEGVGLVAHFVTSLNQGTLNEILDEQVIEEGEEEGKQVAAIAAMCLRMKGEDRPTMRNVEMRLQGLQSSEMNISVIEDDQVMTELNGLTFQGGNANAGDIYCSRQYSNEEEFLFSASLER